MFSRIFSAIASRISSSDSIEIPSIPGSSISIPSFSAIHDRKEDRISFFLKLRVFLGEGSNPFTITLNDSVDSDYLLRDTYSTKSLGYSIYGYLTESLYNAFLPPMYGGLSEFERSIKFSPKDAIDTQRANMVSRLFRDKHGDTYEFREALKHIIDLKCRPEINRIVSGLSSQIGTVKSPPDVLGDDE